jgi:hypothetical protein
MIIVKFTADKNGFLLSHENQFGNSSNNYCG